MSGARFDEEYRRPIHWAESPAYGARDSVYVTLGCRPLSEFVEVNQGLDEAVDSNSRQRLLLECAGQAALWSAATCRSFRALQGFVSECGVQPPRTKAAPGRRTPKVEQ